MRIYLNFCILIKKTQIHDTLVHAIKLKAHSNYSKFPKIINKYFMIG